MANADKKAKKVKAPTAHKRWKQDIKKNARNSSAKARMRTTRVAFAKANGQGRVDLLDGLYSLMDRAAKSGLFHPNKVARLKSRAAKKAQTAA